LSALSPLPLLLLLRCLCSLSEQWTWIIIHVLLFTHEQWAWIIIHVHCSCSGLYLKKNQRKVFKNHFKICDFSRVCFYQFCIISSCIFTL
jgi:hypothetical protein